VFSVRYDMRMKIIEHPASRIEYDLYLLNGDRRYLRDIDCRTDHLRHLDDDPA
jgi:hypothetical protein